MQALLDDLLHYLQQTLHADLPNLRRWDGARGLPRHLTDTYSLYHTQLLAMPCLLVLLKGGDEPTPAELQKHIRLIEAKADLPALYVQQSIRASQRQRLIDQQIPFVVPGRQLYLPPLGLDLREHYRAQANLEEQALSPSAQVMFLGMLMGLWPQDMNASGLAKVLGYSDMTMSRIKRELKAHALSDLPPFAAQSWKQALSSLRSPLRHKVWVTNPTDDLLHCPLAGLSALASRSMLSGPNHEIRAIGEQAWRTLKKKHPALHAEQSFTPDALELELWKYDPVLLIRGDPISGRHPEQAGYGCVDPYSLYLTLRDNPDERIAMSLDEMMKSIAT